MTDFWVVPEPVRVAVARRVCAEKGLSYKGHRVTSGLWLTVDAVDGRGRERFESVYDWQIEQADWNAGVDAVTPKGGAS